MRYGGLGFGVGSVWGPMGVGLGSLGGLSGVPWWSFWDPLGVGLGFPLNCFCRKKKTFETYMTIKRLQSPDPLLPTQGAASVLEPHTSLDSLSTVDPNTRAPASPPEHPQTSTGQASPLGMSVSGTPVSLTPGQILSALDNELELQASDHKNLISALEGTDLSHDNSFSTTTTRSARFSSRFSYTLLFYHLF